MPPKVVIVRARTLPQKQDVQNVQEERSSEDVNERARRLALLNKWEEKKARNEQAIAAKQAGMRSLAALLRFHLHGVDKKDEKEKVTADALLELVRSGREDVLQRQRAAALNDEQKELRMTESISGNCLIWRQILEKILDTTEVNRKRICKRIGLGYDDIKVDTYRDMRYRVGEKIIGLASINQLGSVLVAPELQEIKREQMARTSRKRHEEDRKLGITTAPLQVVAQVTKLSGDTNKRFAKAKRCVCSHDICVHNKARALYWKLVNDKL